MTLISVLTGSDSRFEEISAMREDLWYNADITSVSKFEYVTTLY